MSSIGRNSSNKNSKWLFTKETLGVVLILFSTLALICIITGDKVFSVPGQYVSAFLYGCFGYFSYVLCVYTLVLGVYFVSGKKSKLPKKLKVTFIILGVILALLCHIITMDARGYNNLDYGKYLSTSYLNGWGGLATCSGGGIITGIFAYVFTIVLRPVGSYIVLGLALVVDGFFIYKEIKKIKTENSPASDISLRSTYVGEKVENPENLAERDYPIENVEFPDYADKKQTQKLFINNADDFRFKTKKEVKEDIGEKLSVEYDSCGLALFGVAQEKKEDSGYTEPYGSGIEDKIAYVKKPFTIDVEKTLNNNYSSSDVGKTLNDNYSSTTVSQPIEQPIQNETAPETVTPPFADIPVYEHNENDVEDNSAQSHAEQFSDKYADVPETIEETPVRDYDNFTSSEVYSQNVENTQTDEDIVEEQQNTEQNLEELSAFAEKLSEEDNTYTDTEENTVENTLQQSFENGDELNEQVEQDEQFENKEQIEEPFILSDRRSRGLFSTPQEETEKVDFADSEQDEKEESPLSFGRESVRRSYTSRVEADKNTASAEKPVEVKKEKVIPPINRPYNAPPLDLLETYNAPSDVQQENHADRMGIIQSTMEEFHISARVQNYVQGPAFTRYEIMMPAGVPVKRVTNMSDDLQMRLASKFGVRVQAPIPGKNLVGVEVANNTAVTVGLKEVMADMSKQEMKPSQLNFAIGKDIVGEAKYANLAKGPHYLIAGASGSGKSVCLHVMLVSLIMRYSPEDLRLILIDPKFVEFRKYEHLPHLMNDEIICDAKRALAALSWAIDEMERRYKLFAEAGSFIEGIESYNKEIANNKIPRLPRIVIVIDELADLMTVVKKDLEGKIQRLTQKARAAGIHLVLATQRPSVDVVTGVIKTNLPSRIALKVTNYQDSQIILDRQGAEKLLGNGDMLFRDSSMADGERYQGAWINPVEVKNIVSYIIENNKAYFDDDFTEYVEKAVTPPAPEPSAVGGGEEGGLEADTLLPRALAMAIMCNGISVSQLQRRFRIGYSRAASIVDFMEESGYVSPSDGSRARSVLITKEEYEEKFGQFPEY